MTKPTLTELLKELKRVSVYNTSKYSKVVFLFSHGGRPKCMLKNKLKFYRVQKAVSLPGPVKGILWTRFLFLPKLFPFTLPTPTTSIHCIKDSPKHATSSFQQRVNLCLWRRKNLDPQDGSHSPPGLSLEPAEGEHRSWGVGGEPEGTKQTVLVLSLVAGFSMYS